MASQPKAARKALFPHEDDFSLVLGGPLFQMLRRAPLAGDAVELWLRSIILVAVVAWIPLLVLTVVEGNALTFLQSVEVHVRFLVALPILIVAELVVHQRLRSVVRQFDERDLI